MDLFVFPSRTDTYGNVIQEAAASGVSAVVTSDGGPKQLVIPGVTGFVAQDDTEFIQRVIELAGDTQKRRAMGIAARESVLGRSWNDALEMIYAAYRYCQEFSSDVSIAGHDLGSKQVAASSARLR